ncbi:MAG: ribonuclease III domain-containing protein [Methanocalculus sp.]|nr:ribonuclease III domain-containing protein [Methanocalculus sp.]MDG6249866.1 ribonuclease III domain-containing protein [Methanocalculus sp.]
MLPHLSSQIIDTTGNIDQIDNSLDREFELKREDLEKRIGSVFHDKNQLKRAVTHKSRSNEEGHDCEDQDPLRTLGDAVLKAILCDWLFHQELTTKGEITIIKSEAEKRNFLAELGKQLDLSVAILPGKGAEHQKQHEQPNVIAETLEAIIAAIYLDRGYDVTKYVVSGWYEPYREYLMKN